MVTNIVFEVHKEGIIKFYSNITIQQQIENKVRTLTIRPLENINYIRVYTSGLIEIDYYNHLVFYNNSSLNIRKKDKLNEY